MDINDIINITKVTDSDIENGKINPTDVVLAGIDNCILISEDKDELISRDNLLEIINKTKVDIPTTTLESTIDGMITNGLLFEPRKGYLKRT